MEGMTLPELTALIILLALVIILVFTWLVREWRNAGKPYNSHLYDDKRKLSYCPEHDEWYDPMYGEGCDLCRVKEVNEN